MSETKAGLNQGEKLLAQVTAKTKNGHTTRVDGVVVNSKGEAVNIIEVKSGNAKLSKGQLDLKQNGGTFTGKKAKEIQEKEIAPERLKVVRKSNQ